jgi:hypothetical protein
VPAPPAERVGALTAEVETLRAQVEILTSRDDGRQQEDM